MLATATSDGRKFPKEPFLSPFHMEHRSEASMETLGFLGFSSRRKGKFHDGVVAARTSRQCQASDGTPTDVARGAATRLVNLLLQHEYSINATVRDPHDLKKIELIEEGSFDLVVEGCIGVFHTASLCYFDVKDPQAEMVEPVVKGTLNVLGSYAKVPSIKGVLITFSITAVILIGKPLADDVVVDETWFSDPVVCEKLKTLAKKVDWKFVEENGINMVTINPCMVLEPILWSTLNASVEPIVNLV
ncbi:hypothetical protein Goari_019354, partial [Gossypium aridum]|nr:hypothetical protein [Gossypium aridum]